MQAIPEPWEIATHERNQANLARWMKRYIKKTGQVPDIKQHSGRKNNQPKKRKGTF